MCVCLYAHLWSHGCVPWHLELREQITGAGFLFLPCGPRNNWGYQDSHFSLLGHLASSWGVSNKSHTGLCRTLTGKPCYISFTPFPVSSVVWLYRPRKRETMPMKGTLERQQDRCFKEWAELLKVNIHSALSAANYKLKNHCVKRQPIAFTLAQLFLIISSPGIKDKAICLGRNKLMAPIEYIRMFG